MRRRNAPGHGATGAASREADDQAIEALCFFLDHLCDHAAVLRKPKQVDSPEQEELSQGTPLTSRSGLEATQGQLWSEILRRRIANAYEDNGASVTRTQWMYRHFHVRRLAQPEEGDTASADYVARVWKRKPATVLDNAMRKTPKARALDWIQVCLTRSQQPFPNANDKQVAGNTGTYKGLDLAISLLAAEFPSE